MQIPFLSGAVGTVGGSQPVRPSTDLAQGTQGTASSAVASAVPPGTMRAVSPVSQGQSQEPTKDTTQRKKSLPEELESSVKQLNDLAKVNDSQLEFSVDKGTGIEVVKIVDKETQEVIRQIPSEDAVRIAKAIGDFKGLLLKDQA